MRRHGIGSQPVHANENDGETGRHDRSRLHGGLSRLGLRIVLRIGMQENGHRDRRKEGEKKEERAHDPWTTLDTTLRMGCLARGNRIRLRGNGVKRNWFGLFRSQIVGNRNVQVGTHCRASLVGCHPGFGGRFAGAALRRTVPSPPISPDPLLPPPYHHPVRLLAPINIFPMSHLHHKNDETLIPDFVNHPIVSNPNPKKLVAFQFFRGRRERLFREVSNLRQNQLDFLFRNPPEILGDSF